MERHLERSDWDRVDASRDAASFVTYLEGMETSPLMQRYRQEFCGRLPCHRGERVLDAGCGVGSNARQLAPLVGEEGQVVGLDVSRHMICRAHAVSSPSNSIGFGVGDMYHLPLPADRFDGAICDRVLMHLTRPVQALREVVRVLRPGGWLGLCEPDWSKMRFEPDSRIGRTVLTMHGATFENGVIGSQLPALVEAAGGRLETEVTQHHAARDLEKLWPLLNLERTLGQAIEERLLSAEQVREWRSQLEEAARAGTFCIHMEGAICVGRKEEG